MGTPRDLRASLTAKRKAGHPEATRISPADLASVEAGGLPVVVQPRAAGLRLDDWVPEHRALLDTHLRQTGAILLRGFGIDTVSRFDTVVQILCPDLMSYTEGATPRKVLKDKLYTSTEFPAEYSIALHNELSYVTTWPMRIFFCCVTAPEWRGETPIADVRKVYQRISPRTRERFETHGWMLIRNYGDGFSLPWQKVFHTEDRAEVETYCAHNRIELEWKDGNRLRTRQVRPAVRVHPVTGETVWFNHVAFWHISSLEPHELRDEFLRQMAPDELPYNVFYGDGSPIELEVIDELRQAYAAELRTFPWQAGDLLVADNMLVAHGRSPYRGERRILAAMGEPYTPDNH